MIQLPNIDMEKYIPNSKGYYIWDINLVQCKETSIDIGYKILILTTYGYM